MNTGQIVMIARREMHMTQDQLAKEIGISRQTLARIESGDYMNFTAHTAVKLARALGLSLDVLLCLTNEQKIVRG